MRCNAIFLSCRLLYQIERQFNLPDEKGLTYLFLLIFVREEEIQKSVTKCLLFYIWSKIVGRRSEYRMIGLTFLTTLTSLKDDVDITIYRITIYRNSGVDAEQFTWNSCLFWSIYYTSFSTLDCSMKRHYPTPCMLMNTLLTT